MVELSFNSETTISGSLKFDFRQLRWFSIGKYINGDFWTKTMLERPSRLRIATSRQRLPVGVTRDKLRPPRFHGNRPPTLPSRA